VVDVALSLFLLCRLFGWSQREMVSIFTERGHCASNMFVCSHSDIAGLSSELSEDMRAGDTRSSRMMNVHLKTKHASVRLHVQCHSIRSADGDMVTDTQQANQHCSRLTVAEY
jgi:hypothetical protein